MTFGERLKIQIKKSEYTMELLANKLGVSKGAVSHWANDVRRPKPNIIKSISEILQINPAILFEDTNTNVMKVPIMYEASCGLPIGGVEVDGNIFIDSENYKIGMYAVVAVGDSMLPEINNGDRVLCSPHEEVNNGDIVHYRRDGESAIKVFFKDTDLKIVNFIPFNSNDDFKTVSIHEDELSNIYVSKVVDIISSKRNNRSARLKMIGR